MSTPDAALPYTLLGPPIQRNKWSEQLQTTQTGFDQRVRWNANGAVFTVFVPDTADLVTTVDSLARFQGAQFDALTKAHAGP